ncbi:MAG TPA: hypothetical protein VL424_04110, partial [Pararobbsia sp.]|nr:hypothetical protein [Pararobbsia sp.]
DAEYLPFYLRYLIRRVQQRVPGATIVFGLGREWIHAAAKGGHSMSDLGNANLVATLHEMTEACVLAAHLQFGGRTDLPGEAGEGTSGPDDTSRPQLATR